MMKKINITMREQSYELLESIRTLRTNLLFCGDDKQIVMITSSLPGEGKTETAILLANSLAEIDKKVLLIDADMRKSYMAARLEAKGAEHGLSHVLSGQCDIKTAICATNIPKLHMLFAGHMAPNPTELLETKRFENLLAAFRTVYDYIIIDCPPLGMVVDGAVIAKYCDGSIVVVEADKTKYRLVQHVKNRLAATKTPILGVILNKVEVKKNKTYYSRYYGKKYSKQYGNGYGHYGQEEDSDLKKRASKRKQA